MKRNSRMKILASAVCLAACAILQAGPVQAQALPFLPAGDAYLRHEVELNQDEGRVPLSTTWPLPSADVPEESREIPRSLIQPGSAQDAGWFIAGGARPTRLRTFEDTPREKAEVGVHAGWAAGDYAGGVLRLAYDFKPQDEMHYRLDESYAAWRYGNWWVTLGAQSRWWGPGWDGSLLLSNNARPTPGISLDRVSSKAPDFWLMRWVGPWRLTTFMDHMEGKRPDHNNTLLWGARLTMQPIRGLELGLSRTAMWCGQDRPCGLSTFWKLFTTRQAAQINASGPDPDVSKKAGAQQGAIDLRWHIPGTSMSLYWQDFGQTFDSGNFRPRLTLQMFGVEFGSRDLMDGRLRTFIEYADTTCGAISTSSSDKGVYGCAYETSLYPVGFRYRGRSLGDALDRDGRRLTAGVMYVDDANRFWQVRLRKIEINRGGLVSPGLSPHTVSVVPETYYELAPTVSGQFGEYRVQAGGAIDQTKRLEHGVSKKGLSGSVFLNLSHPW